MLSQGREIPRTLGIPLQGFIAPAWLLSREGRSTAWVPFRAWTARLHRIVRLVVHPCDLTHHRMATLVYDLTTRLSTTRRVTNYRDLVHQYSEGMLAQ
jgi:predicted deacetylase